MIHNQQLMTWDPVREMETLSHRMNRLFDRSLWNGEGSEMLAAADWCPACDISESEKEYHIKVELPNVNKDDVHVTLEGGVLTIRGDRREEKEVKDLKVHRRELFYGKFVRRFVVPEHCDEAKIEATFKNGMLNVVLTKEKTKAPKSKEIAIKG